MAKTKAEILLDKLEAATAIVGKWMLKGEDGQFWVQEGQVWVKAQTDQYLNRIVRDTLHLPFWVNPDGERKPLVDLTQLGNQSTWAKRVINALPATPYSELNPSTARLWLNTPAGECFLGPGPTPKAPNAKWTFQTSVAPVEGPTPLLDAFLQSAFDDETERQRVLTMLSLTLRGDATGQKVPVFQGDAGTGKTTLALLMDRLLGGYATELSADKLTRSAGRSHEEWKAELAGMRLVRMEELPDGTQLNASLFKSLMSGAELTARRLNRERFKFVPGYNIVMATNFLPNVATTDGGISRRLSYVKMNNVIPEELRAASADEAVENFIASEGPAILWTLIQVCRTWDGVYPAMDAGEQILIDRERSGVARWLEERCVIGVGWSSTQDLHERFQAWASKHNHADMYMDLIPFGMALKDYAVDGTSSRRYAGEPGAKKQIAGWDITVVTGQSDTIRFTEDGLSEWQERAAS